MRIFLVHHITWSVNSVCHFLGTRRFETDDHSTNVAWLSLPSFGESWHHNHHAFPRSANHGLRRWETLLDPSALLIGGLEKVGLARNVVRIAPERQAQREHAAPRRCGPKCLPRAEAAPHAQETPATVNYVGGAAAREVLVSEHCVLGQPNLPVRIAAACAAAQQGATMSKQSFADLGVSSCRSGRTRPQRLEYTLRRPAHRRTRRAGRP